MEYFLENNSDQIRKIAKEVRDIGCEIEKYNQIIPTRVGGMITLHDEETRISTVNKVESLNKFFTKGWKSLLPRKIQGQTVKSLLGLEEFQIDQAYATLSKDQLITEYFGVDLVGAGRKICDLNSDRATIVGFQQEISEIYESYYGDEFIFPHFYDMITPLLEKFGVLPVNIFVLTHITEPYKRPIANFAKRFGLSYGSITDFDPKKHFLVIRQVRSEEIINHPTLYNKLLNALKKGLPMINPLGSYIGGHKGWLTVICALGYMPREWFPKTWLVNKEIVLDSSGNVFDFNQLSSQFSDYGKINNRKKYILKKDFGSGGWQVFIGDDLKRYQWEDLFKQIKSSTNSWIIEEKEPRNNVETLVCDFSEVVEGSVSASRLNILERIYGVNGFKDYCGESFGKDSNKVNASGFTFPLAFPI